MDYCGWGREYLGEALRLKRHAAPLRARLAGLRGEDRALLARRIAMLNEMYLECLHTGRELIERGKFYEARLGSEL